MKFNKNNIKNKATVIFAGSFKPPHIGHFNLVRQLSKNNKFYIIISKKPRDGIDATLSLNIWNIYLSTLPKKQRDNIVVSISPDDSPITTTYKLVPYVKTQKVILIKSDKNANNKRYENLIKRQYEKTIVEHIMPTYKALSSTNMRQAIIDGDKKTFDRFLPSKLTPSQKHKIYKIIGLI